MDTTAILHAVSDEIEHDLRQHEPEPPASIPATITTGVATALLQKSIRRGRTDLALAAAEVLSRLDPDRLWRRLVVVAFEDVGVANADLIYQTVTAAAHRVRLARRFGGWRLVSLIVSRLAASAKCRAADDLHVAAFDCPAWHVDRLELSELPTRDLFAVIASGARVERRAVALRQATATGSHHGRGSRQGATAVFELLSEIAPHTLGIIARAGYRQTGEIITAFMPLLWPLYDGDEAELVSDRFPPEMIVGGVPSWALDGFSREGRRALTYLLSTGCPTARWLRANVPPADRTRILRHAQFRIEAGLVADRVIWPTGQNLRRQADLHSWPFPPEDAAHLLGLLRCDIATLNDARDLTNGC